MKTILLMTVSVSLLLAQDASVKQDAHSWTLASSKVERTITLDNGRVFTSAWKDLSSGRDLLSGARGEEFAAGIDGTEVSGRSGGWTLVSARDRKQSDGSLAFDLTLRRGNLEATKSYVIYSGSSILREWVTFKNLGSQNLRIDEPRFLTVAANLGPLTKIDFHWMTGGENEPGSWVLKTEALPSGAPRKFDSYDPFPGAAKARYGFKMGSAIYAPWNALFDRSSGQGLFIGFDYFGHWTSGFTAGEDGSRKSRIQGGRPPSNPRSGRVPGHAESVHRPVYERPG